MSSAWYSSSSSSSFVTDEKKALRDLHPNQFYKICPSGSSSSTSSSNSASSNKEGPICGDGSPFCFYVTKPSQRASNNEKLLIELMGGGACWDYDTCQKQANYLYVNGDLLDATLGRSCKEVQYSLQDQPINVLCSGNIGTTDFTTYNTIIVPYCTQDVHVGSSSTMTYSNNINDDNMNDDSNNGGDYNVMTVHHMGSYNIQAVLDWIYKNFPNLRHATVTGCSAGGTAVPIVHQLLHQHYNHFGNRNTQLVAIADSPVYLTPSYFLQYGLPNWNPQRLFNKMGVPYQKYKDSQEDYPTLLWDFILRKGDNRNRWGFVSHTNDPVSLTYYQYMSGSNANNNNNNNNDDDDNGRRNLEDNNNVNNQWYTELTNSVKYIENKHRNVKSYWMDSEGHCSFGMYYALQDSGFESFAASIVQEDALIGTARPAVNAFLLAAGLGLSLIGFLIFHKRRRTLRSTTGDDDTASRYTIGKDGIIEENINHTDPEFNATRISWKSHWRIRTTSVLTVYEEHPLVTGYGLCLMLFFWFMIIEVGFCHPVNNPSLGPNAVGLSQFGINNPALIVYQHQWFRLLASNFLVSGVFTFGYAVFYMWFRVRHLERRMLNEFNSPWLFVTVAILLASAINAIFCLIPTQQGASCSAIPLLMGLHACQLTIYWNSFVRPYLSIASILLDVLLISLLFPFNSWVMMLAALLCGPVLARLCRRFDEWLPGPMDVDKSLNRTSTCDQSSERAKRNYHPKNDHEDDEEVSYETMNDQVASSPDRTKLRRQKFFIRTIFCGGVALFVLFLIPLLITLVASPNPIHGKPFYTGCKLFYTTDFADLSSLSFLSNDDQSYNENQEGGSDGDDRRLITTTPTTTELFLRWLQGDEEYQSDFQCADFCIPHMITPVLRQVIHAKGIPIHKGTCQEQGYSTKVVDKTYSALSYSLDVELYSSSTNVDEEEEGNNRYR